MMDRFNEYHERQEENAHTKKIRITDYSDNNILRALSFKRRSTSRDASQESPTTEGIFKPAEKFEDILRPRVVSKELGRG